MRIKNTSINIIKKKIDSIEKDVILQAVVSKVPSENNQTTAGALGEAICLERENSNSKYIIQCFILDENLNVAQKSLRNSMAMALRQINALEVSSVALSAMGSERGNFPLEGSAKIMIQEILKFLKTEVNTIEEVIFCIDDDNAFNVFNETIHGYVDHIQDTLGDGPYVTVDIIIEYSQGIVVIQRSNPPYGWALPGGFVDYGESLESAALREAKEETHMDLLNLRQFHAYSNPNRDLRFHTVSTVFVAEGKGTPAYGDDAKGLKIVKYEDLLALEYAFDHKKIIEDYLNSKK